MILILETGIHATPKSQRSIAATSSTSASSQFLQ